MKPETKLIERFVRLNGKLYMSAFLLTDESIKYTVAFRLTDNELSATGDTLEEALINLQEQIGDAEYD